MKNKLLSFLFTILLVSCSFEQIKINSLIKEYESSLNTADKTKFESLFSNAIIGKLIFAGVEAIRNQGITSSYRIEIMWVKINGKEATARMQVFQTFSGEGDTVKTLNLINSSPQKYDLILSLNQGKWLIDQIDIDI